MRFKCKTCGKIIDGINEKQALANLNAHLINKHDNLYEIKEKEKK